jgi:hypothetical protein
MIASLGCESNKLLSEPPLLVPVPLFLLVAEAAVLIVRSLLDNGGRS